MICPKCKTKNNDEVTSTWHTRSGTTRRRRCFTCGTRYTTKEIIATKNITTVAPNEKTTCKGHQFYALYSNIMQCKNCGKTISHR